MKKVLFLVFLSMCGFLLKAQNIDDIRKMIYLKQYTNAKTELDKYLAVPANAAKADGWYYKAFLYSSLAREANESVTNSANLNTEAFAAIKKYKDLDAKQKLTKEEENSTAYNLYYTFYDLAVKAYNNKDYATCYTNFSSALEVHDYVYGNGWEGPKALKFAALDTDVVFNLLIVGAELKKSDELVPLYKKIIDNKLTDEKYLSVYENILLYYKKVKNQAAFDEYLAKGKSLFPKDDFWEAIDIENATDGLENEPLFKKYDELLTRYPNSYVLNYNYGFELNKYLNGDQPKTGDVKAYREKVPELFKKAISIKSTVEANMVLANFYYNNSYDLSEESKKVKGTKPEDVKKRQELNAAAKNNMTLCVPVAEEAVRLYAAMPKLKMSDKVNYKLALEMLGNIAKLNGNAKKAEEYEKQKLDVDKL